MRGVWRRYRALGGWLQWTIGIGLVLLVVVALPSSEQQPAQERAAEGGPPRVPRDIDARTPTSTPTRTPARSPTPTAAHRRKLANGTALAALDALPVKGRAPKTGYDREQFGGDWASIDGCDTRERILAATCGARRTSPAAHAISQTGRLADPYTAT